MLDCGQQITCILFLLFAFFAYGGHYVCMATIPLQAWHVPKDGLLGVCKEIVLWQDSLKEMDSYMVSRVSHLLYRFLGCFDCLTLPNCPSMITCSTREKANTRMEIQRKYY